MWQHQGAPLGGYSPHPDAVAPYGYHGSPSAVTAAAATYPVSVLGGTGPQAGAMGAVGPGWLSLEGRLRAKLDETAITREDVSVAESCLKELSRVVEFGPGWAVRPFGSISNGFAKHGSDLDATCCKESAVEEDFSPHELQVRALAALRARCPAFEVVEVVAAARIPIVRLKFQGKLDVDLSFLNTEPLPNTQLLRAYAVLGPEVRDLGVLVKLWADALGICGAQRGHLSAYALTLMVIYYMQVDPAVRLPVLPTHLFTGDLDVPAGARVPWVCKYSRSELLYKFFNFFANEFQWGSEVVSIRVGRRLSPADEEFSQLRGRFSSRLHLEDPFLLDRNLHCVLKTDQEGVLYQRLWEAAQAVQQGLLPVGLQSEVQLPYPAPDYLWMSPADMGGHLGKAPPLPGNAKVVASALPPSGGTPCMGPRLHGPGGAESDASTTARSEAHLNNPGTPWGSSEGLGPIAQQVPRTKLKMKWLF